jgi:phosphatidylinositol alpha-1,6-mannosyltransferase
MKEPILIISVDFPPHTDGVSTVAKELAERLAGYGKKIVAIGPVSAGDEEYDKKQNFIVIRTLWYELGYLRFIPLLFASIYAVTRYRIKLILAMNIAYGGIISYFLFRPFGIKYILWAYGYEFCKFQINFFLHNLYKKIYLNAEKIFSISHFVKDRLIQFGIPEERIGLIFPGTSPEKYFPAEVPLEFKKNYGLENRKIILSVSRLIERKGFDMVIRSVPVLLKKFPNLVYLVVGNGPLRQPWEALVSELNLNSSVRFLGRISNEELFYLYNACDIFIMPSREIEEKGDVEGFGIVYLEANACGKPVIGGRSGGCGEAILDGQTGILVDPLSVEEVVHAIDRLLSEPALARTLGENGRQRVLKELNWDNYVKKFLQEILKRFFNTNFHEFLSNYHE